MNAAAPLLEVLNLTKHFPVRKGVFSRVSVVVRLTYHYTTRDPRRELLNADAGLQYRF